MHPSFSLNNDSKRIFPILNDRVYWRKIDYDPLVHKWYYGINFRPDEFENFHLNVFSSTDLLKGSCDNNLDFQTRIKCMKGI